ncbi:hypothetical protein O0I10_010476 [Lichtheimia ornata]|uniref:WWE domain-containing protein n=1 Tax=Lichtheimia ornata TaxID=688661 RepID=A0AAD7UVH2_9FUNG|nr:uncharacterized protein O0I10_010476 [Lichtheimia ornata]KAJ8653908.1 hypothetical protein O0I10_010476 [Lichtheimia ornata]
MHPPTSLSTPIHSHSSPRLDAMRSPPTPITHHHNSFDLTPRKDSKPTDQPLSSSEPPLTDFPQEVTWLFFRDNQWIPFQSENHYKIEQAFTMGGIYVDIKDHNFPQLKSIRVFPARFYLSYLGMKYRLSCVIQG